MKVSIYHHDFPANPDALTLVAHVEIADHDTDYVETEHETACELAWRIVQNINGSWSRGPQFDDGATNPDFNEHVEVVAPLPVIDGKTHGLRSAMMGDVFEIDGERYRVAMVGFDKIEAAA
jgi:hypothetical protein